MRPAEGELHVALAGQRLVAVHLQGPAEADQVRDGLRRRAVGRVDVSDAGRVQPPRAGRRGRTATPSGLDLVFRTVVGRRYAPARLGRVPEAALGVVEIERSQLLRALFHPARSKKG